MGHLLKAVLVALWFQQDSNLHGPFGSSALKADAATNYAMKPRGSAGNQLNHMENFLHYTIKN